MPSVTLDELDTVGCPVALESTVAAMLADSGLVEVRPEASGSYRLLPRGRVGAVRVGDVQVQVTPKEQVGLSRLLFLLGYARDPGWLDEDVAAIAEPDLWPALAQTLARQARRALMHGVLQGYRTRDDALRTVRGRIRIGDQIARRPGLMMPLEVTYDEYSQDITENRILRTALRRMLTVPRLSADARASLAHLDATLTGVEVLRPGSRLPAWQRTRMNARYHAVLRLAEIILRNSSTEVGGGGLMMAAFVVPMWQVYEDFVTTALTESLSRFPGHTRAQFRDRLDVPTGAPGSVPMYVDLVHSVGGAPRMIFDAKYKVSRPDGRYPNADHYQMLAYCTALKVPRAWLVYAQGGAGPVVRRIVNTDFSVVEYPLDLRADPRELLRQIDVLAESAWHGAMIQPAPVVVIGPATGRSDAGGSTGSLATFPSARLPRPDLPLSGMGVPLTPAGVDGPGELSIEAWASLLDNALSDQERALLSELANRGAPLPLQGYEAPDGTPFDLAWPEFRLVVGTAGVAPPPGWTATAADATLIMQALARREGAG